MNNVFDYVDKYGDINFTNKVFNDVDNLVFSLLSYLDFTDTKINENEYTLKEIGKEYLNKNNYKSIKKLGIAQRDAYKLLEILINKSRYCNIKMVNYIYNTNKDIQFSAVTFIISKNLKYICFEGTDEKISGWKEDAELACFFPVPSHIEAIKYVNKNTHIFGHSVIIGGHSKGGNLALVAGMYMQKIKKFKVIKVYSNDGPGLRYKEFNSKEYKNIKKKYIHIVPDCSIVGVLLRNDTYKVVKSIKKDITGHSISTWIIDDDKLLEGTLSSFSIKFSNSFVSWLDNHDDNTRIKYINAIFKVVEDENITTTTSLIKVKNIIKIISKMKNLDKETVEITKSLLSYNLKNMIRDEN